MKKEQKSYLEIDGLSVEVTRKNMKNLYLRIKPPDGKICVSAPLFLGEEQIISFVRGRSEWIKKNRERALAREMERHPNLSAEEEKILRENLGIEVQKLLEKYEPLMGVKVSGITIRKMKTRWGSCNVKTGHINLNLELAWKTKEQLEYVVVHEMCHLLEASHNQVFWSYVESYFPDWKRVRRDLRT